MPGMGKSKIGYTNEQVPWYYGWNPGGFGCSGGCDGCWARPLARLSKCEKCRNNEVHLHEERLTQPADTEKPGVVLVNFTNDWLDRKRSSNDVITFCEHLERLMRFVPSHTYITLTKNASWLLGLAEINQVRANPHIYHGLTIRNQQEADEKLPTFLRVPGNLWLSLEPINGPINLTKYLATTYNPSNGMGYCNAQVLAIRGCIIGHDNRKGAPGTETLEHIRSVVQQCKAAHVPCYVKQLWVDGKLRHDPKDFPEDLRVRELPWSIPKGEP